MKKNAGRKGRKLGAYGKAKQPVATVIVCGLPGEPGTYGKAPDDGHCPECGAEAVPGFGLGYGGFGPYYTCSKARCKWFWKRVLNDDES